MNFSHSNWLQRHCWRTRHQLSQVTSIYIKLNHFFDRDKDDPSKIASLKNSMKDNLANRNDENWLRLHDLPLSLGSEDKGLNFLTTEKVQRVKEELPVSAKRPQN